MPNSHDLLQRIRAHSKKALTRPKRALDLHKRILDEMSAAYRRGGVNDPELDVDAVVQILADSKDDLQQGAVELLNALASWGCLAPVEFTGPVLVDDTGRLELATVSAAKGGGEGKPLQQIDPSDPEHKPILLDWIHAVLAGDEPVPAEVEPFEIRPVPGTQPPDSVWQGRKNGIEATLQILGDGATLSAGVGGEENPPAVRACKNIRQVWPVNSDQDRASAVKQAGETLRRLDWALRRVRGWERQGG